MRHLRMICGLISVAGILSSGTAFAQTAYLEGHIFNKRLGVPIRNAVVVVYENITVGPLPFLLAKGTTDENGFYQFEIGDLFPVGVIEVFCRTKDNGLVTGGSFAPLQDQVIRRRDIFLDVPRRFDACLEPEPGDIPPFF